MQQTIQTVGRRKTSTARILLRNGKGSITINNKSFENFFPQPVLQNALVQPLKVTNNEGKYDIQVLVEGGGTTGQVDAISLGIARALVELNEENRIELRKFGLLTRDPRMVERKKYGQKKARKRFQFSKR
ncbi:MAG: 30S ribosomal protein S9 [Bacteroidota bacterium]